MEFPARRPAAVLTSLVAGAALLLAACSGTTPEVSDDAEPPLGATVRVDPVKGFALPLDAFQPDAAGRTLIDRAHAKVFDDCMRRFGVTLRLPDFSAVAPPQNNRQRYGIWDGVLASRLGYHPAPAPVVAQDPQLDLPAVRAIVTGAGQTVNGLPEGGCQDEANRAIDAGTPGGGGQSDLVDRLSWTFYERAQKDSRLRRVTADWSDCMAKAGYRYRDPMQANNDPAFEGASPSPTEIKIATADVQCKQNADLIDISATVETAYQRRAVDRNAAALSQARANRERTLRNATAILDPNGG